jgi:cyclic di-GMP phosphodiesterase Gmr
MIGDEVLRVIATRLSDAVRATDTVGRWAGDEFVIVCPGIESAQLAALRDRLHEALRQPVPGCEAAVGASVGAVLSRPGDSAESLIAHADRAMYDAKRQRAAVCG